MLFASDLSKAMKERYGLECMLIGDPVPEWSYVLTYKFRNGNFLALNVDDWLISFHIGEARVLVDCYYSSFAEVEKALVEIDRVTNGQFQRTLEEEGCLI